MVEVDVQLWIFKIMNDVMATIKLMGALETGRKSGEEEG